MKQATLIGRNVRRNLRRSVLTAATIALATFIYAVLISVPGSIDRIVSEASTTLRLIVGNRTAPWYDLPARYCDQIRAMPGAAACVATTRCAAFYRDLREPIIAGADG